eukprot:6114894-Amphidinium_carterae.1
MAGRRACACSLSPGSAAAKFCDVCKRNCPRTAWSWECQRCNVEVCPAHPLNGAICLKAKGSKLIVAREMALLWAQWALELRCSHLPCVELLARTALPRLDAVWPLASTAIAK